jgi:enamine deaminase RidA (YjgF/YER057c/UK114 family)
MKVGNIEVHINQMPVLEPEFVPMGAYMDAFLKNAREPIAVVVYREMGKWLKGVFPCSTGLVITALARPEWLVEIEVTAVIPD